MATVYLATEVWHSRRVALEVLKPKLAAVVGAARFLAEIERAAKLQHPHIPPLFDSGARAAALVPAAVRPRVVLDFFTELRQRVPN